VSRGGARRSLDSNTRSGSPRMAGTQGIGGTTPRGGDIVTPGDMLARELLEIRYALALRSVAAMDARERQHLNIFGPSRSTSSPDRRSPVSSRAPSGPPTVPAATTQKEG